MSLLEKAKGVPALHRRCPEDRADLEELALAFFRSEVGKKQISAALGKNGSVVYATVAVALRNAIADGRLRLDEVLK